VGRCSERASNAPTDPHAVADAAERRWAIVVGIIIALLVR
jgi:hypothetical protein